MRIRLAGITALMLCGITASCPVVPLADDVAVMKSDPPAVYGPIIWRGPTKETTGFFFTDAQVIRVDARIKYLEATAAKECVDTQIAVAKTVNPWIKMTAALLTGAAIGYCAGADHHCGIKR